jgi:flavin-dependent dehydrogenase
MTTFVGSATPDLTPDFRGRMIDRAAFDAELAARAVGAGAICRYGTMLRRVGRNGVVTLSDDTRVAPRVIIGADGPRSAVGSAIRAINSELVETRQVTVALIQPFDATDIFLDADIVGGYGWLFPRGAAANLGVGIVPSERRHLKPRLDRLHRRLVAAGRVGSEIHSRTGGPIPVGGMVGPVGQIGRCEVFLAGDAAGLSHPVTGAGIAAAVQSGKLAGAAAASGAAMASRDYADEIADLFGSALARAARRRRELLDSYAGGRRPNADQLRRGWIAYPEYWAA